MHLGEVKAHCGDRLCLLGNIDCRELLPNGTPQQVEAAVVQAIKDAGRGGGLVISSSNSLHPGVDPDNCIAMFEATRKHGSYGHDGAVTGDDDRPGRAISPRDATRTGSSHPVTHPGVAS